MLRLVLTGVLMCGLVPLSGQNLFNSPPPETEQALRNRIDEYYGLMKAGQFRQSDAYVAEESKDAYYEQEKRRIRGHEVVRINWEEGFQKAVAVVVIQTDLMIRGQKVATGAPFSTRWKLENGNWFLYFDTTVRESPFGKWKADPGGAANASPEELLRNPNLIFDKIVLDKKVAELNSYEKSTDSIRIKNGMPGSISLSFQPTQILPGFTYTIERETLDANEETNIVFEYDPGERKGPKPTVTGQLKIDPFGKSYEIKIQFAVSVKEEQ